MTNNFCTLFDSFYLNRALVLHQSLMRHCKEFHLYIFAFDDATLDFLNRLNLRSVTVIAMRDFENPDLIRVKPMRTRAEYCWTCTPFTIEYAITKFNLDQCTYVDADLCFYGDPAALLGEMGDKSVLITEHRYTAKYDTSKTSGIYCVQFISFKRDEAGMTALTWWRDRCLEWCYDRVEDGKFGDQKYLDDWPVRFKAVHVLHHIGGGVAPWNVQQYTFSVNGGTWLIRENDKTNWVPLIFYHFHHVRYLNTSTVDLSPYDLKGPGVLSLYASYLTELDETRKSVSLPLRVDWKRPWKLRPFLRRILRRLNGTHNVFNKDKFVEKWRSSLI